MSRAHSLKVLIFFTLASTLLVESRMQNENSARYRLNGALLFANWDSIRANINMGDILDKTFGEIVRKADGIFQRSEIKGQIVASLPNEEYFTIFERSNFDSVAFLEPRLFSVEFDGPKDMQFNDITIACDIEEKDVTSPNDIVCQGSQTYKVYKNSELFLNVVDSKSTSTKQDISPEIIAMILNSLGYEKLYAPTGAKNITEILEKLINFDWNNIEIFELVALLEDLSGIFLVNLGYEEVSTENKREGDYKRVDDSWSIRDNEENGREEPHGQLYILPQAMTITVLDFMENLNIPTDNFPDKFKDAELPFIRGPSFPLFDYTRAQESVSDYAVDQNLRSSISAFYKNAKEHSYVVFSTMWDTDGNHFYDMDECLAKGNAFGFDTIDLQNGNQRLSQCDYTQDVSIEIYSGEVTHTEQDTELVEYELKGTFDFKGYDGNGENNEPFGYFSISIGIKPVNQNFQIWRADSNQIQIKNYQHYKQPFMVRFLEERDFIESNTKITLHGSIEEYDTTSGDDLIGNYNGQTYLPNDLTSPKRDTFPGEDDAAVYISLHLKRVDQPENPVPLIEYELQGLFAFVASDGPGTNYEPYGDFSVSIGSKLANQNKQVWHSDPGQTDVQDNTHFYQPVLIIFKEREDFMDPSLEKNIILHGNVKEYDTSSGDDLIGDYDNFTCKVSELTKCFPHTFSGEDNNEVAITLRIVKPGEQPPLVGYKLSGTFDFVADDGPGSHYEPYGEFVIDIGNKPQNIAHEIWRASADSMEVEDDTHYTKDFDIKFEEEESFLYSEQDMITLHGKVMEYDTSSGDDLIGDYDLKKYNPSKFTGGGNTLVFYGDDNNKVTIFLKLEHDSFVEHDEL